jgi:tRNA modification GTPase
VRLDDDIAAISTPPGRGGIGVVRISGRNALAMAGRIFQSDGKLAEPGKVTFGRILEPESGEVVDRVVASYYKSPHSYTGDDVVELSCHGSPLILNRVLGLLTSMGARIAEPGEFTMRAMVNGKIDLSQAQAVRDLIDAQTNYQARLASRQLEGALAKRLAPLKKNLIDVVVHLESAVEFVEEDISTDSLAELDSKLIGTIAGLEKIASSYSFGRIVAEGFNLAIVGRPNVGKSSVFNRLVGADRAIVTEVPGTTRDMLRETTAIEGVPVRLVDTAGIRHTSDPVETIGIDRTWSAIADADMSLTVLDGSEPLTPDDHALLEAVSSEKRVLLVNKTDLPRKLDLDALSKDGDAPVMASALTGEGFEQLTGALFQRLCGGHATERDDIMLTDARQHQAVERTLSRVSDARSLLTQREHEEIVLLRLREALDCLGEITGETLTEDILSQIFSSFCIGK